MLSSSEVVRGIPKLTGHIETCIPCKLTKSKKSPHKNIGEIKSTELLELVHSDLWGPAPVQSLGGSKYFVSFVDDFSRHVTVFTISRKSQAFECFKEYKALVEKQTGKQIKSLRTDNGMEYCNNNFNNFCKKEGIKHERTNEYSPQMNGVAERLNYTLLNIVRAFLCKLILLFCLCCMVF